MVDTMAVLGAAACAKLTGDRLVRDFLTYLREARVTPSESTQKKSRRPRKDNRLSRPLKASTSGLGPRPSSLRRGKKLSHMTDAELEAELEKRKRRRAKERDVYSRALRSEKLAALESELTNLRREIRRIDPVPSNSVSRSGTPHSVHWEPLPKTRRSAEMRSSFTPDTTAVGPAVPTLRGPPPSSGPPPPPPPLPPTPATNEEDGFTIDPEQRKREKEERQRRREAKKKEREQAQKKLTLADIIKSAGPDPMKRLKPASMKPADVEKEEFEKQKREREEREMRQERERIELEKKAIENMGRRVTEQGSTNNDESNNKLGAEDPQQNSESEDVHAEGVKKDKESVSQRSEQHSANPNHTTLPGSENVSTNVQDDLTHPSHDEKQDDESKDEEGRNNSESTKLPPRNPGRKEETSLSLSVSESQPCAATGEQKIPNAPENLESTLEGKNVEEILQVKNVSKTTATDTENISPNASSTNSVPGNKPERKIIEEVDKRISRAEVV